MKKKKDLGWAICLIICGIIGIASGLVQTSGIEFSTTVRIIYVCFCTLMGVALIVTSILKIKGIKK